MFIGIRATLETRKVMRVMIRLTAGVDKHTMKLTVKSLSPAQPGFKIALASLVKLHMRNARRIVLENSTLPSPMRART